MKTALFVLIGLVIGYCFGGCKNVSSEVTYNEQGKKTVISTCDKEMDCKISIGQECTDDGFKIVKTDHDDQKVIVTAECITPKAVSFF